MYGGGGSNTPDGRVRLRQNEFQRPMRTLCSAMQPHTKVDGAWLHHLPHRPREEELSPATLPGPTNYRLPVSNNTALHMYMYTPCVYSISTHVYVYTMCILHQYTCICIHHVCTPSVAVIHSLMSGELCNVHVHSELCNVHVYT